METLKKIVDFIVSKKDTITTVIGFIIALAFAIQSYMNSGEVTLFGLIQAIGIFLIAWFTGKQVK